MIFLSASIPDRKRNSKYFDTANIAHIRDAVIALVSVVIPKSTLTWGGHPAITSLIAHSARQSDLRHRARIYQSEFFGKKFPSENQSIDKVTITPTEEDEKSSLQKMRTSMLQDQQFNAGIFIGGMEGVEEEYKLFKLNNPRALALPIARTGGAASLIQEASSPAPAERLLNDFGYVAFFRHVLRNRI